MGKKKQGRIREKNEYSSAETKETNMPPSPPTVSTSGPYMYHHPTTRKNGRFWFNFTFMYDSEPMSRGSAFLTRSHMRPAKTQNCLRTHVGGSQSLLSTWRCFGSLGTNRMPCEDSDQTARMRRLIWVFTGRTSNLVGNAVPRFRCPGEIW